MPDYEAIHFQAAQWNRPWCPHGPFGLGALGSIMSLPLLRPGILVSPPCLACPGGDGRRPATAPSPLQHGLGEGLQEPGSTCQASAATPCPDSCPLLGMCPLMERSTARWGGHSTQCSHLQLPGTPGAVLGCGGTIRLLLVTRPPAVTWRQQRGDGGRRWPGGPVSALQGAIIQRQQ